MQIIDSVAYAQTELDAARLVLLRRRDAPKVRIRGIGVRSRKAWMVENIEPIEPRLQTNSFRQLEIFRSPKSTSFMRLARTSFHPQAGTTMNMQTRSGGKNRESP